MKRISAIKHTIADHRDELRKKYKVREIGIFGSYARNENTRNSDIDILVDFEVTPDLLTFIEIENYLEHILKAKIDLVRKPVIRKEIRDAVLKELVTV